MALVNAGENGAVVSDYQERFATGMAFDFAGIPGTPSRFLQ